MSIHLEEWMKRRIFLTVWEGTQPVIDCFDKSAPLSRDLGAFLKFFFFLLPQPVIGHDTDRSAADKGVDKALLIILSLLTDKQACLSEAQKKSPWHRRPLVKTLFFSLNNSRQRLFSRRAFLTSTFVSHLFCPSESNTNFIVHRLYLHYTWGDMAERSFFCCINIHISISISTCTCPKYSYSVTKRSDTTIWVIFMFLHLIFMLFTVFLCYICQNITHSYD